MELYLQSIALTLVAVILVLVLRQNKEIGALVSLGVCAMLAGAAAAALRPVLEFLAQIRRMGGLDREFLAILLKAAGIGFLSELAALICSDAGETALAKALQLVTNTAVLLLSLPLLQKLAVLLEEVLGEL